MCGSVSGGGATHGGNSPLQRAIYSFLIFPSLNSADSSPAVLFDNPRIINPEVNLSRRFTANGKLEIEPRTRGVIRWVNALYILL